MTTIGDSFAVVALLVGIGFTAWALTLAFGMLFPGKTTIARNLLIKWPLPAMILGVTLALTVGAVSLFMSGLPMPLIKFAGVMGLVSLLAVAVIGGAGITTYAAERIQALDPRVTPYGALARACMLLTVGTFFPLLGWFLIGPALLVASLGVGTMAIFSRVRQEAAVTFQP